MTIIDHWDVESMMIRILENSVLDHKNPTDYDFTQYLGKLISDTHSDLIINPKRALDWPSLVEPCWHWQGANSGKGHEAGRGYGRISYRNKTHAVHRIAYNIWKGRLTAKQQVDHICNNRICCNPHHLQSVTCLQNHRLRVERQNGFSLEETFQ